MNNEKNSKALKQFSCPTHPTDRICITDSVANLMFNFVIEIGYGKKEAGHKLMWPYSDIFFANTIPLKDCEIEWTDDNPFTTEGTILYRVVIYPNYEKDIQSAKMEEKIFVGFIQFKSEILLLFVEKGNDRLLYAPKVNYNKDGTAIKPTISEQAWLEMVCLWYETQITLLHPLVKDVLAHPQRVAIQPPMKHKQKKKRPVHYVKRHVINADELKRELYGNNKHSINRQTMVWYVIGHWRQYKNGKKIFIQPYWKGPLRNTKKDISIREREVIPPL